MSEIRLKGAQYTSYFSNKIARLPYLCQLSLTSRSLNRQDWWHSIWISLLLEALSVWCPVLRVATLDWKSSFVCIYNTKRQQCLKSQEHNEMQPFLKMPFWRRLSFSAILPMGGQCHWMNSSSETKGLPNTRHASERIKSCKQKKSLFRLRCKLSANDRPPKGAAAFKLHCDIAESHEFRWVWRAYIYI